MIRENANCIIILSFLVCVSPRERKNDRFDVATTMNYGVASFLSWSKSICNPKMGIMRKRVPNDYCILSKANTLNMCGQADRHVSPQEQSP